MKHRSFARAAVLLTLALAACERTPLDSAARPPEGGEPDAPVGLARLACTVTVASGALACAAPDPATGSADGLVVGGQNGAYVYLNASGHTYTAADSTFSIDVTVQNLIFQSLGTTDGSAVDAAGVRIYFGQEPALPVEILNEQRGMITAPNQAYFQYAGRLDTNETSEAVEWRFRVPPSVPSFQFTVLVSAAVQFPSGTVQVTPGADTVLAGGNVGLSHTVRDAYGNAVADQAVTWATSNPAVATVNASGTVTAVAPGTATITATQGARSGAAPIAVCPNLATGGVYVADMPAGSSLCLGAGEYVLTPMNTGLSSNVSLNLTGAGIVPVSGAPTPALLPGGARTLRRTAARDRDRAWESRLRRKERAQLPRRITSDPRRAPRGPRMAITPGVPAVGSLMTLNAEANDPCDIPMNRVGRVMAVGTRIIVIADTLNPDGGLSPAQYAAIADSFDTVIWPTITGTFGTPGDIDGNGRVIAFYTGAVNELTEPGSGAYVGGFVWARDLFPTADCPTSNVGEMFYMLAADPAGELGNEFDAEFVMEGTLGTLAHEFEHLINASRRMYVNTPWNGELEEVWLDEGLAHVAEELMFYQTSGLAVGSNLGVGQIGDGGVVEDAFFRYAEANFGRLQEWLAAPHTSGAFKDDDQLSTRGATWAFLRYASDRHPSTDAAFFSGMVNTDQIGLANVQTAVGADVRGWYRDFVAATYADDAGIGATATYTQPSWNLRGLYAALDYSPGPGCSCIYPLVPRNPTNGVTSSFTLSRGGGTTFARVGVPASAFAGIRVLVGSSPPGSNVRMAVIRRK